MKERYRVSIFGAARVGKTEIINRFCYENNKKQKHSKSSRHQHNKGKKLKEFQMEKYVPTIEDFYVQMFDFSGVSLPLEIVDTCGTEQFPAMRKLNIERSQLVILVYDVTRDDTIYEAIRLYHITRSIHPVSSGIIIMFVGAKIDLLESVKKNPIVEKFTEENTDIWLRLVFCSAKTGFNINKIFKIGFDPILPEITANEELKRKLQISHSSDEEPVSPLIKHRSNDKGSNRSFFGATFHKER